MELEVSVNDAPACRDHVALFDRAADGDHNAIRAAIDICATCPLIEACAARADALNVRHGVWGGQDRSGRIFRARRPIARCGTASGYRRHLRRGEATSGPCRAASNERAKSIPSYRAAHTGHNCKLTAEQVEEIREASDAGETGKALARKYGVSRAQISNIVRGRAWTNV